MSSKLTTGCLPMRLVVAARSRTSLPTSDRRSLLRAVPSLRSRLSDTCEKVSRIASPVISGSCGKLQAPALLVDIGDFSTNSTVDSDRRLLWCRKRDICEIGQILLGCDTVNM